MRLPEEVDPGAVLPLRSLEANHVRRQPVHTDSPVCSLHQSDGNPNLDVSARPWIGLPPLCCKVDGYPSQDIRSLHTQ